MDNVMSLEPVVKGALMPDAHQGYGMPIGGVCAVKNAVIPYAVGVDIGCRMQMTVLAVDSNKQIEDKDSQQYQRLKKALLSCTFFGGSYVPNKPHNHRIMDDKRWALLDKLKLEKFDSQSLKDRAWRQLGTSGGGNHFVEWGVYDTTSQFWKDISGSNTQLALMSHSGSRALGYTIANYFTKLASELNPLPAPLNELSWLSMDTEEGQLYYELMCLCGDYSAANHDCIHDTIINEVGLNDDTTPRHTISNHHNFAWREFFGDELMYVHRKGATPAAFGEIGIIPSSMATKAYVVVGVGNSDSIRSASHGSGRAMSRSQALKTITREQRNKVLEENKVELLGAGLDESPQAYKDIDVVMNAQKELVNVIAEFQPRIVRMGGKDEVDRTEGS